MATKAGFGSRYKGAPAAVASGGGFGSRFATAATEPSASTSGHHGVLGFAENLGDDIEHAATGFLPGVVGTVEHPIRAAKQIGESYKQEYGPLLHGHVNEFLHQLYAHPLQPALDLATIVTGGAGLAAKAGLLSHAAEDITVPGFGAKLGAEDASKEPLVIRQTSRNPAVRTRQLAVNKALNKLPADTPVVGSATRAAKAIGRKSSLESARLAGSATPFAKAYGKLNQERQAAFHLIANGVHPKALHDYLTAQKDAGAKVSEGTLKTLSNPFVAKLYEDYHLDPKLSAAVKEGEKLSNTLTAEKVTRGLIDEKTAAESPYRALRVVNGAKYSDKEKGLIDREGRDIPTLAREVAESGRPQPFYLPMRAEVNSAWRGGRPFRVQTNPTIIPKTTTKHFKGVLLQNGLLHFGDTLTPEVMKTARLTRRADLHDALMAHALRLHPDADLPQGWRFLKVKAGEHLNYTDQIRSEFEHNLKSGQPFNFKDLFTTGDKDSPHIATDELGGRLAVPNAAVKELQDEVRSTTSLSRNLIGKPTSAWKQLILNLRPATFANLTVGNHILAATQAPSLASFIANYARHAGAGKLLGGKLTEKTMESVFPEQEYGAFGTQEGFAGSAHNVLNKVGVMRPTIAVENMLRRALTESWARDTPEVRAELRVNGGDINKAIRKVAEAKPEIRQEISRRVDAALGNYRNYSNLEQKIRTVVPFYGWDRHIARSTGRILSEFPHRADAIRAEGQEGNQEQTKLLGNLPSYAEGALKLGHVPGIGPLDGRTPILATHSLNPFSTIPDLTALAAALVHGKAGSHGAGEIASTINPFIQAVLEQVTGRNLVTGAEVKGGPAQGVIGNTIANTFGGVPQATLVKQLLASPPPPNASKLYRQDWQTTLASLLGVPVKKLNLAAAAAQAAKGY